MAYSDLHLPTDLADAMTALGWTADDPFVRGATPSVARGHNLVGLIPPAPAWAAPVLAGLLAARRDAPGLTLLLAPPESLPEWAVVLEALIPAEAPRPLVALGPGQASRRLHAGHPLALIVMTPATALELRRRSLLALDALAAVVLAWPERWDDPDALTALMADMGRDTQRVILTASGADAAPLAERYAFKALTVGPAGPAVPAGPVRTVTVPWSRRVAVLSELAEVLDPESLAVWTVDTTRHHVLRRALTGLGAPVEVTHQRPGPASCIVAFDPPSPEALRMLLEAGPVVLLAPPGSEPYLRSIAEPRTAVPIPGELDAATSVAARRRNRIERVLREADLHPSLLTLSPLFEQHEPAAVAAALFHLWTTEERPRAASTPSATAPAGVTRLWVGVGKKDAAGAADLVGLLTNELKLERSQIGKVEVRETFSLVEVPAEDAQRIASAMTGKTVRRRRVVARVDAGRGPERPARPPRGRPPRS